MTHRRPVTFGDAAPTFAVDNPRSVRFTVDRETRTIRGLALPFGDAARDSMGGGPWTFDADSEIVWDKVKLLHAHDWSQLLGTVSLEATEEGIVMAARVARTAAGDEVLALAEPDDDGNAALDGLSAGFSPEDFAFEERDGVNRVTRGRINEVSTTPLPAFTRAAIRSVAASAAPTQEENMKCTTCGIVHAQGVTACKPEDVRAFAAASADALNGTVPPDFAAAVTEGVRAAFGDLTFPQRETVPAGASFSVSEPSPYRFDGIAGAESFSADLRNYNSDSEARVRLEAFMEDAFATFAVTSANAGTLNPTQNRPDLFVPNLTFTRPLWEMVTTGSLDDKTPFTIPKFSSAAGLVGAHTEGVEPTPGSFSATSQTVTPGAMSGKVEIVREVWDQGGSPQADQIIWGEMLNGYFEAIEARIATVLNAVPTPEVNLASAVNGALVTAMTNLLVDLQFTRGGNRFSALALDGQLGKALVNAEGTDGRKLLPVLGPTNAQGTVDGGFDGVNLGTLRGRFAWALGATNASKSHLFVPSSVYAWASAPKEFRFEYRVSAVDLAIWGYTAAAVTRDSDVKPLDYTTADA